MPNHQPYLKICSYFSKKEGLSFEQFHEYWETIHADLVVNCRSFIVTARRYVQFHSLPEHKELAKGMGVPLLPYDGCSEIYVRSWADWEKIYHGEEYQKLLDPDAEKFLAHPIAVIVGYENLVYGAALPGEGTADGVPLADYESTGKK